jgi:hypothetical protein
MCLTCYRRETGLSGGYGYNGNEVVKEQAHLEFRKGNGTSEGGRAGYYLGNKFLHEYKAEALAMLRENFHDYSDEEKAKFKDEWDAISYEYEKGQEKQRKIQDARHMRLQEKIENEKKEQEEISNVVQDKIKEVTKMIKLMKGFTYTDFSSAELYNKFKELIILVYDMDRIFSKPTKKTHPNLQYPTGWKEHKNELQ